MKNFYLAGQGIGESLSPAIHSIIYKELGIKAAYHIADIRDLNRIKYLFCGDADPQGFNITRPFKRQIIPYLDADFSGCKSVNTIKLTQDASQTVSGIFGGRRAEGFSTDGLGFILDVKRLGLDLKRVIIYGAGGAARAVAYALKDYSEEIYILNRTESKTYELLNELKNAGKAKLFAACSKLDFDTDFTLLVNCTNVDFDVSAYPNLCNLICYDLKYCKKQGGEQTKAKQKSKKFNGLGMLIYQAVLSAEIMLGIKIGIDMFDIILREI